MTGAQRAPFEGTLQILRYNWDFYVVSGLVLAIGVAVLGLIRLPVWLCVAGWIGLGLAAWWWVASIAASFWIYDASGLMAWSWVGSFGGPEGPWINLHSGLDESTIGLSQQWGEPQVVLDFFDEGEMTERSILRARKSARNAVAATPAGYSNLPLEDASYALASVVFSAHELRSIGARDDFFEELRRVLKPGGAVFLVEHPRDPANFFAFGPGFFHFMPEGEWRRLAADHGFVVEKARRFTPFIGVFLLRKPGA